MKIVYIAGPFTADNAWERENNIRDAEALGMAVAEQGAMPLIPHTNTRFFDGTVTPKFWYEGTLELLRRCDAVVVVECWQGSKGTQREIDEAVRLGIPVFQMMDEWNGFLCWVRSNG